MSIDAETLKKECFNFLINDNELYNLKNKKIIKKIHFWKKSGLSVPKTSIFSGFLFSIMMFMFVFLGYKHMFFLSIIGVIICIFFLCLSILLEILIEQRMQKKVKSKIINFIINSKNNYLNNVDIVEEVYDYEKNKNCFMNHDNKLNLFKEIEMDFFKLVYIDGDNKTKIKKDNIVNPVIYKNNYKRIRT